MNRLLCLLLLSCSHVCICFVFPFCNTNAHQVIAAAIVALLLARRAPQSPPAALQLTPSALQVSL